MGYYGSRMTHPHNSESAVRIVLQFCTMKATRREIEITLMVVLGKDIIQGIFVILAQKWYVPLTPIWVKLLGVSLEVCVWGGGV